jgi:hypothetical protein
VNKELWTLARAALKAVYTYITGCELLRLDWTRADLTLLWSASLSLSLYFRLVGPTTSLVTSRAADR